jgi:hypothetical protein
VGREGRRGEGTVAVDLTESSTKGTSTHASSGLLAVRLRVNSASCSVLRDTLVQYISER